MAIDSIYVRKSALKKLRGVEAFVGKKKCNCSGVLCVSCLLREEYHPLVAPGQWLIKGEELYIPMKHAAYIAKPECIANTKWISLRALRRATLTRYRGTA